MSNVVPLPIAQDSDDLDSVSVEALDEESDD